MTDLFVPLSTTNSFQEEHSNISPSFWQEVFSRLRRNPIAVVSTSILCCLLLVAIMGPFINSHTYFETNLAIKNHPPSSEHWFGTDDLGRDIFIRICYGARISLFVGITAASIDLIIGVLWGSISAFAGGKIDNLLMRFCDILHAIPHLLMVVMLMVVMRSGLIPIIIALTITGWINMARIVRGQIFQLKERDYILAAVALGASRRRILFKHLIPNAIGPIIVTMTLTIPMAIFTEAFLSFLGLGVQVPMASWGTMASDGLPAMRYYPWRLLFPACFMSVTMLAFNLLGDALRDALDPKLRKFL